MVFAFAETQPDVTPAANASVATVLTELIRRLRDRQKGWRREANSSALAASTAAGLLVAIQLVEAYKKELAARPKCDQRKDRHYYRDKCDAALKLLYHGERTKAVQKLKEALE